MVEISRLPDRPWCQGGHCMPCPAPSFVGSKCNPVMSLCSSGTKTCPNHRVLVSAQNQHCLWLSVCSHSLLGTLDPLAVATTIGSLASARERAMEGSLLGWSKRHNQLFPVAKGPGRGRSPGPHLGDAGAPTEGSFVLRRASHACSSAGSVLPVIQSGQSRRNHVESVTESQ